MPAQRKTRSRNRLAKRMYREEDNILYMFGCLAYGVDFDSREIQESIKRPADREFYGASC
jgi:hypothetical protein